MLLCVISVLLVVDSLFLYMVVVSACSFLSDLMLYVEWYNWGVFCCFMLYMCVALVDNSVI